MTDLNAFAPAGVTFWAATGINESGQITTYDCTGGTCRSYLLTPAAAIPEPASLLLLTFGVVALRLRRSVR
jgi:hypothetical protein